MQVPRKLAGSCSSSNLRLRTLLLSRSRTSLLYSLKRRPLDVTGRDAIENGSLRTHGVVRDCDDDSPPPVPKLFSLHPSPIITRRRNQATVGRAASANYLGQNGTAGAAS